MRILPKILLFNLVFLALIANVSAMRCQGKIITEGDDEYRVSHLCGKPDYKKVNPRYLTVRKEFSFKENPAVNKDGKFLKEGSHEGEITDVIMVEEWFYNFGPNRLIQIVEIIDGEVTDIRDGGYGYREKK